MASKKPKTKAKATKRPPGKRTPKVKAVENVAREAGVTGSGFMGSSGFLPEVERMFPGEHGADHPAAIRSISPPPQKLAVTVFEIGTTESCRKPSLWERAWRWLFVAPPEAR